MKKILLFLILYVFVFSAFSQMNVKYDNLSQTNVSDSIINYSLRNIAIYDNEYFVITFDTLVSRCDIYVKFFPGQQMVNEGVTFEFFNYLIYNSTKLVGLPSDSTIFSASSFNTIRVSADHYFYIRNIEFRDVQKFDVYGKYYQDGYVDGKASINTVSIYNSGYTDGVSSVNSDSIYNSAYIDGQSSCLNSVSKNVDNIQSIYFNDNILTVDNISGNVKVFNMQGNLIEEFQAPSSVYTNYGAGVYIVTIGNFSKKIMVND